MRTAVALIVVAYAGFAGAKLPPPTDAAKAQSAEAAAKTAWSDKVSLYQTCRAQDRAAEAYRRNQKTAGKDIPSAAATTPCADPGPYVAPTPVESKPLEASGAHSPPGAATSPPSTNTPAAEMPKAAK
jgi:hypothetical protein